MVKAKRTKTTKSTTDKDLADKLFPVQEEDFADSILNIPPEQRKLVTETYDFSIATILDYLDRGEVFVPEYQRRYVWNDAQASRLIESLIIQCPIPVIYLSQTSEEKLSVIDGNQRLNSIQRYVNGEFPLKGLTAYPELEGFHFSDLDPRFQRHIMHRTLRCIVILKETHPQVKFDIFERINTGAVQLSPQELRHGIYNGELMDLLETLDKDKIWRKMIGTQNTKRMKGEELILRFFALNENYQSYSQPLSNFLNDYASSNRTIKDKKHELEVLFREAVDKVDFLYDKFAFRLIENGKPKQQFNIALFDAQMLSISLNGFDVLAMTDDQKESYLEKYINLFKKETFMKSISRSTTNKNSLYLRVQELVGIFKECGM